MIGFALFTIVFDFLAKTRIHVEQKIDTLGKTRRNSKTREKL